MEPNEPIFDDEAVARFAELGKTMKELGETLKQSLSWFSSHSNREDRRSKKASSKKRGRGYTKSPNKNRHRKGYKK